MFILLNGMHVRTEVFRGFLAAMFAFRWLETLGIDLELTSSVWPYPSPPLLLFCPFPSCWFEVSRTLSLQSQKPTYEVFRTYRILQRKISYTPPRLQLLLQKFVVLDFLFEPFHRGNKCVLKCHGIGLLQSCDVAMCTPYFDECIP